MKAMHWQLTTVKPPQTNKAAIHVLIPSARKLCVWVLVLGWLWQHRVRFLYLGNPNGGLAKGGLARKGPIGPKRALSGQFLLFPRGCGVQRNWSRSAPKRPRPALKWRQFAPKRPDFPGRISPRFSLKIWGLSPRL